MFVHASREQQIAIVRGLAGGGPTDGEVAEAAGLTRGTVNRWKNHGVPTRPAIEPSQDWRPADPASYAYLLGLYLGDGYISHHGGNCYGLSISLDDSWPRIVEECRTAITTFATGPVHEYQRPDGHGLRIYSYSGVWPAAFPQHGPGRKHLRTISLSSWQEEIVDEHPRPFLRGLIHSDGSRCINRFEVQLKGGVRTYAYPRYFFSNLSADIRGLFCRYCEKLGVKWTQSNPRNISVSHRASVAILDSFIGPKS
jgi:hypothetical protein